MHIMIALVALTQDAISILVTGAPASEGLVAVFVGH